jgi:hypothetical protein
MKPTLTLLTALLLAPLAALQAAEPKPANKPIVIVILSDDLGWADLSCYGSAFHESPNLDKLAAQGSRMADQMVALSRRNAWALTPWMFLVQDAPAAPAKTKAMSVTGPSALRVAGA